MSGDSQGMQALQGMASQYQNSGLARFIGQPRMQLNPYQPQSFAPPQLGQRMFYSPQQQAPVIGGLLGPTPPLVFGGGVGAGDSAGATGATSGSNAADAPPGVGGIDGMGGDGTSGVGGGSSAADAPPGVGGIDGIGGDGTGGGGGGGGAK